MLEGLQARADAASPFLNSVFAVIWGVAGFAVGLAQGGAGKQLAFAIIAALFGFFFPKVFVTMLRFA